MRTSDLLNMCARNLARRKFRTLLTVMGVVVGTSLIVVMISLGLGIELADMQRIEQWGDLNVITIFNFGNEETPLDSAAIAAIVAMPGVEVASPRAELRLDGASAMIHAGRRGQYEMGAWSVVALYPQALDAFGYRVAQGQTLTSGEDRRGPIQVLFGEQTAYQFRDTRRRWPNDMISIWDVPPGEPLPDPFFDPLTETTLTLSIMPWEADGRSVEFDIEVVGIMQGVGRNWETLQGVVISLYDKQYMIAEFERANNIRRDRDHVESFDTAWVRCYSMDDVGEVEAAIRAMGFHNTFSLEQERQAMQEGARQIQMILGFIGGITLFVSALSIMNTMIMSVYERTREIGLMKVLGCALGNIRSVFLIEAALIGFFGGIIGSGLSLLASMLLNTYGVGLGGIGGGGPVFGPGGPVEPPPASVIPPWLLVLGLVFATCVGLISGLIPALRAVKISALEAIRTE